MMKTTIALVGLLITTLHVSGQKIITEAHFPINIELKYSTIEVEPVLIAKSAGLAITKNYIVFMRSKGNNIFSVFDFPSCKYIGDFATFGKGPNEFLHPDARNVVACNNGLTFFDAIKGQVSINVDKLVMKENYIKKQIKLPGDLFLLNDAKSLTCDLIWGRPYPKVRKKKMEQGMYMYASYNINSNQIEYFGEYPNIYKNKSEIELWGVFSRHSSVKPDGTRIASFFDNIKMIRIYSKSKEPIKEQIFETQEYFSESYRKKHGIKHYYKVVKSTNKYIYALCYNAPRNMFLEVMPTIEVWNWKGDPVAMFKMSNSIFTFDVTPDDKKIYCVDNIDINRFYVYDIESIIN